MELIIFKSGFSVAEFNAFSKNHIIYKYQIVESGDIYVMFKNLENAGTSTVENIEEIDKLITQAQKENLASSLNVKHIQFRLNDLEKKLEKTEKKTKEWEELDITCKMHKKQILQDKATIEEREAQIVVFKAELNRLIAEIK